MLNPEELRKATRLNRFYAYTLSWQEGDRLRIGWIDRFDQIVNVLGLVNVTPGEEVFAQAVAD